MLLIGAGALELAKQIRNITKEEALLDYKKLQDQPCKKINQRALQGQKAMDFFTFAPRLKTKGKKGLSFIDYEKLNNYKTKEYEHRLYKQVMAQNPNAPRAKYQVFRLYYDSISAFKPIIAKHIYCKFNPTTVLDFSAGWGGRCLGAMASNINYIGFDTNKDLKTPYKNMIKMYPHDSKVEIYFKDSSKVDFSKYNYDCVFTSPPYYRATKPTETYEHMPEYKNRDDFNERFFFPVVSNSYKHMKKGHYILNIPIDMYDDIKKVLGKATKKFPLQLAKRGDPNASVVYKEFVYVWVKN